MEANGRPSLRVAVLNAVLLGLLLASVVYAATVTVDTFDAGTHNLTADPENSRSANAVDVVTGDVLGNERDAEVNWISGEGEVKLEIDRFNSNKCSYTSGSVVKGWAAITWDGNDNDPDQIAYTGLNNANLKSSNPDNDALVVALLGSDHDSALTFTAYEDQNNYSTLTIEIQGDTLSTRADLVFPFDSFVKTGSGADWSSLGALVLKIDGTIASDLDLTIDYLEASNVREYGDLPLTDPNYGTTILEANHIPQGLRLGHNVDAEATYNASAGANGDDTDKADDEDGVAPSNLPWSTGSNGGQVTVVVVGCAEVGGCYINGWIDWDSSGDFDDTVDGASEHIVADQSKSDDGTYTFNFNVPTSWSRQYYYARFRICKAVDTCDSPTKSQTNVEDGEIEDYRWWLGPTAVDLASFTAAPGDGLVTLEWATTHENDLIGFNLWRGTKASGPEVQLNTALIPAHNAGTPFGSSYSFTDRTVVSGATYYYWLEAVEVGNQTSQQGPIMVQMPENQQQPRLVPVSPERPGPGFRLAPVRPRPGPRSLLPPRRL